MSSPFSMLKKTKRTPLQDPHREPGGRAKVPFKRNLLREIKAELANEEDKSSDQCPHPSTSRSQAPSNTGTAPSDFELMSAMMRRVTMLEKTVRTQAQEIERKDKRIAELEETQRPLKESANDLSGRDDLERRCQQLQNQVCDMERFLSDYGLVWVGDGQSSDSAESEQPHSLERADADASGVFCMDFDLVLQRIRELNVLAGEGECFVRSTATGAQLAKRDPIQLSLYSNGIVMFDGPFRSYQEHSTQCCMQDLMDGYFPSELQERFPDGVPFEVRDKRDEEFILRLPWNQFPGEGRAVHGEKDESSNAVSSLFSGRKMTTAQFLNKLPKVVVRAGRVIDIRDSVRAVLQGSSDAQSRNSAILIDTPALQASKERLQPLGPGLSAPGHVISLKLRSEDGNRTFIVKMHPSETIGHLRQYLDKHRGAGQPGYDIISVRPQRCYGDDHLTLQSLGLRTNTTLMLRNRQRPRSSTDVNKVNQ